MLFNEIIIFFKYIYRTCSIASKSKKEYHCQCNYSQLNCILMCYNILPRAPHIKVIRKFRNAGY